MGKPKLSVCSAVLVLSSLVTAASAEPIADLPMCSASRTNKTCKLVIDRRSPVSPSTLQLYSGHRVVVIVKGAIWTERYFLDSGPGQAAVKPDVAAALAQSLIAPLGKLQISLDRSSEDALLKASRSMQSLNGSLKQLLFQNRMLFEKKLGLKLDSAIQEERFESGSGAGSGEAPPNNAPVPGPVAGVSWRECDGLFRATAVTDDLLATTRSCVGAMSSRAMTLYSALEPFSFPDTVVGGSSAAIRIPSVDELHKIQIDIDDFVTQETRVSAQIGVLSRAEKPPLDVAALIARLGAHQKIIDTIAGDLLGYSERLADLSRNTPSHANCASFAVDGQAEEKCVALVGHPGPDDSMPEPTSRSVTYAINVINLVTSSREAAADSGKKRTIASLVVSYAGDSGHFYNVFDSTRWDGSVGLLFSALPNRTFSVAPIFANGAVTDKRVNETTSVPTPVPFVAINYRLTNDLPFFTWKANVYVTGLAGINPNTSTTDFGAGLSFSWRSLMLSLVAHWGHDTELTQGFAVDQHLGSDFSSSLPTRTFWTRAIAVGLSIRVPSITGR